MPEVAVDVWYKVGARDEAPGRTGFAHLFEHVMFQGTKHIAEDKHFEYLQKAGASSVNGSTSHDRTNYFEVVPSNQLELALWLESERMGFLLDRAGFKETVDNQRDVVKNERRQRYENRPDGPDLEGAAGGALPARSPLPPPGHRLDGGPDGGVGRRRQGVLPHLLRARATRRWSSPATSIAPRPRSWSSSTSARSRRASRSTRRAGARGPADGQQAHRDGGEDPAAAALRRVSVAGELRARRSRAGPARPIVLGGGKSSRLYKRLVYDMKIAQSVSAAQQSQLLASAASRSPPSPMPGHTLDEILAVIDEEIAALQAKPRRRGRSWTARRTRSSPTPSAAWRACWRAPSGCSPTTTWSAIPAS